MHNTYRVAAVYPNTTAAFEFHCWHQHKTPHSQHVHSSSEPVPSKHQAKPRLLAKGMVLASSTHVRIPAPCVCGCMSANRPLTQAPAHTPMQAVAATKQAREPTHIPRQPNAR
eukprot:scpid20776/ scgid29594/ 